MEGNGELASFGQRTWRKLQVDAIAVRGSAGRNVHGRRAAEQHGAVGAFDDVTAARSNADVDGIECDRLRYQRCLPAGYESDRPRDPV